MPSIVKIHQDLREKETGNSCYNVKGLWASHLEFIRLSACGLSQVAIARQLGVSPQTVSNVLSSDFAKERLNQIIKQKDADAGNINAELKELFPLAKQTLQSAMLEYVEAPILADKDVRSQAVRSAMALTDHVHPKTIRQESITGHLTLEQIEKMKRDASIAVASVVEAEVVVEEQLVEGQLDSRQ